MKTKMAALLSLFLAMGLVSASSSVSTTTMANQMAAGLCGFKTLVTGVLPTLALILFLFAGLAYAAGQVFGTEMRAKAQGWAMSLLIGGIIGIVLTVLAPILVSIFVSMSTGGRVSMSADPCAA